MKAIPLKQRSERKQAAGVSAHTRLRARLAVATFKAQARW